MYSPLEVLRGREPHVSRSQPGASPHAGHTLTFHCQYVFKSLFHTPQRNEPWEMDFASPPGHEKRFRSSLLGLTHLHPDRPLVAHSMRIFGSAFGGGGGGSSKSHMLASVSAT